MLVNKDQENPYDVRVAFEDGKGEGAFTGTVAVETFGKAQYRWHPDCKDGWADPDGPVLTTTVEAGPAGTFRLPAASVTVLRGRVTF
jgi:hypothetical protein